MGKSLHQPQGVSISAASTIRVDLLWPEFRKYVDGTFKALSLQFFETNEDYQLFAIDDSIVYLTTLVKDPASYDETFTSQAAIDEHDGYRTEFETSFKVAGNQTLDVRGTGNVRVTTLDAPKDQDRKPVFTMSPATQGFSTWITGRGDNPSPTPPDTGRGTGTPFLLSFDAIEDRGTKSVEFEFLEPVEIHDGQVTWREALAWTSEDSFSLGLRIPASSVTANGSNTGNCNKVPVGPGVNIIVPAAGDGAWDLETACPVEDRAGSGGYWSVDYNTGDVTPSVPGAGHWNLFDFEISAWLIRNIIMNHPLGVFDIDVYKVEYFHPSWRLIWEVTKNSAGAGDVAGWIFCFRRNVT